jgi:hypothetical protein
VITIYADISCDVDSDPIDDSITVRFYDGDPDVSVNQIGDDQIIFGMTAGEMATVQVIYTVGDTLPRYIYVRVDPQGAIDEYNEENNEAFKEIRAVLPVAFDIKPRSCPNPLNTKKGDKDAGQYTAAKIGDGTSVIDFTLTDLKAPVIPVAILGTDDFDVRDIDPTTLTLMGVPALRWAYEDVTEPMPDDAGRCECTTAGADGFVDLTIKFDKNSIVSALGVTFDGQVIPLTINGSTYDGVPIEGVDCVVIRGKKSDDGQAYAMDPGNVTSLVGASPNPFNPVTTMSFNLARTGDYSLTVYNIAGQVVRIFNGNGHAGRNEVTWDASDNASGVYLYRLTVEGFADTKKMLLLK